MIRNYLLLLLLFTLAPLLIFGQIGPSVIIDSTVNSVGISKFESADLDNDGDLDIITANTGQLGSLAYYQNNLNSTFSSKNIIDNFPFCKGVAIGDFNKDNWVDIVAIGGVSMEAKLYFNNNGVFANSVLLDSNISIQLNDVVVEDFDGNGSLDIVIIGQHSMDFYRNNGIGNFTKEIILSTSTSPLSLECLDLAATDIDSDGDMDLICGETQGLVVYTNSGNAVFTPNYYSVISEISTLILPIDIDNDLDQDIIIKNNAGDVKWFSNNGSGLMSYESILPNMPNLTAISAVDYNGDGYLDIYASYAHNISVFLNDASHLFSAEISIRKDNNLIMGEIDIADIDNAGAKDYLWSGSNRIIGYNINQNENCVVNHISSDFDFFYPNPTSGTISTNDGAVIEYAEVYSSVGKLVLQLQYVNTIDLSEFKSGLYIIKMIGKSGSEMSVYKVIKQ